MSKRLAITISGAVSLGSFEGGVLYEILNAIGQHNSNPATPSADKICVDVITGASAGGMTATIAAQKLLYERGALDGAYSNAFYRPWVSDVSMSGLLNLGSSEKTDQSILSSNFVADISRQYLTARYGSHADVPRNPHPAINTDQGSPEKNLKLRLGLAMSNLNGVDYGRPMKPSGKFVYTKHQDQLTTWFDVIEPAAAADDKFEFWDPLRNAAVSCGAFPFAFRLVDVTRHDFEYKNDFLASKIMPAQSFTYTDGGVFQNEPLGMAKSLVDQIDEHQDTDNRHYLYVSPDNRDSTAVDGDRFNSGNANFKGTALRLVGAIFSQARFQDWITADEINRQVKIFNESARGLQAVLSKDPGLAVSMKTVAGDLLPRLIPDAAARDKARERLKKQFGEEYKGLPDAAKDVWIDSILVLETSAQLADSDEMDIYSVTANPSELASADLVHFAGFFDRSYREHDYDVGRDKARKFLSQPVFGLSTPIQYKSEDLRPIDAKLNGLTVDRMDPWVKTIFRDRLRDRAKELMKEAGLNLIVRDGIDLFVIKKQLDDLLKIS